MIQATVSSYAHSLSLKKKLCRFCRASPPQLAVRLARACIRLPLPLTLSPLCPLFESNYYLLITISTAGAKILRPHPRRAPRASSSCGPSSPCYGMPPMARSAPCVHKSTPPHPCIGILATGWSAPPSDTPPNKLPTVVVAAATTC
jgi:hypothetical protein